MIKLYVSNDSDISADCLYADTTKLISYFEETECELENEDCQLFLLEDYVKEKDQQIADLKQQLEEKEKELNEIEKYVNLFDCKDFNEFKNFIGICMLTPHEQETLILDLKDQLHTQPKEIVEKIKELLVSHCDFLDENNGWYIPEEKIKLLCDKILKEYGEE